MGAVRKSFRGAHHALGSDRAATDAAGTIGNDENMTAMRRETRSPVFAAPAVPDFNGKPQGRIRHGGSGPHSSRAVQRRRPG